jgi:sortase (surface protein transpeptidase)
MPASLANKPQSRAAALSVPTALNVLNNADRDVKEPAPPDDLEVGALRQRPRVPAIGLHLPVPRREDRGEVGVGRDHLAAQRSLMGPAELATPGGRSRRHSQCFGEIFPAKVCVTIFPSFTTNVSVPSSYRLSAVSAFQTM